METKSLPIWNVYDENCPTRVVLDCIANKWTVLIIGRLAIGTRRFGELKREVTGISQKVLTKTLRELERNGIVARQVYASVPPKVEYSLTPLGCSLTELVSSIQRWAESHIEDVLAAQSTYDEEIGLANAIQEGRKNELVSEEEVLAILRG